MDCGGSKPRALHYCWRRSPVDVVLPPDAALLVDPEPFVAPRQHEEAPREASRARRKRGARRWGLRSAIGSPAVRQEAARELGYRPGRRRPAHAFISTTSAVWASWHHHGTPSMGRRLEGCPGEGKVGAKQLGQVRGFFGALPRDAKHDAVG